MNVTERQKLHDEIVAMATPRDLASNPFANAMHQFVSVFVNKMLDEAADAIESNREVVAVGAKQFADKAIDALEFWVSRAKASLGLPPTPSAPTSTDTPSAP